MTTPRVAGDMVAFADVYSAIRDHRRGILVFIVSLTALAAAASMVLPTWYNAGAEFSIESAPTMAQPSGVLGLAAQLGLGTVGGSNSINYYAEVLESNQVLDQVALRRLPVDSAGRREFLYTRVDTIMTARERDQTRKRLRGHLDIYANARTNTITFSIEARSPLAARVAADTLLAGLNRAIITLRRQHASAERVFLEVRVDSAVARQRIMEDSLRQFYVHNRVVNTPNLMFTEARLKREVEFAQTLVSQLRTQLEQARLQEVRDTPALSVISAPEIPGKRSRPNRRLIVLAAFFSACLLSLAWAAARLALQTPLRASA